MNGAQAATLQAQGAVKEQMAKALAATCPAARSSRTCPPASVAWKQRWRGSRRRCWATPPRPTGPGRHAIARRRRRPDAWRVRAFTADGDRARFLHAAATEFERALRRNLKGLDHFTTAGPQPDASPKDVQIERDTVRLYHHRPLLDGVYRVPILLAMATTNRGYIFDMVPGHGLVEHLLRAGADVFMLDG